MARLLRKLGWIAACSALAACAAGEIGNGGFDAGAAGAAGAFEPGAAGGSGHDHGAPAAGSGGSAMPGPMIDRAAIPNGDPGSAVVQIRNTSEKPGPGDGTGAFRTSCDFSHMNFDDPIVFPGQPGKAHLHAYFGNSLADADSTPDSLRTSGNSTCRGGIANRSAYWVPALIDANGKPIKPASIDVYYKTGYGGVKPGDVKPFPKGLRMIAGDAKSKQKQSRAYWGCLDHYIGKPGSIPDCGTGETLMMSVEFPQCWDGVQLDSADHKSHMAYPGQGGCPATHPKPIPAITFQVHYRTPPEGVKGWRLASDMYEASLPGGFSAHGDWYEAWDPDVVKAFIEGCDNPALDCHSHLLGDGRAIY
ncbi:MAG TPA: DUF1996 domain-containing protein [Polyangiales bacterium]|nr:DUF1996 domain-containing protein [Polyangiales bacterium]